MPIPITAGTDDWQRQPGRSVGIIDRTRIFCEIPYRGAVAKEDAFRANWKRGDQCPITKYQHLYLVEGPTITDEEGGAASCVLRFEGPDINGEFGEADPVIIHYYNEHDTCELQKTDYVDDIGIYLYAKVCATSSYVKNSRDTSPDAVALDDPDPPFKKESGGRHAPEATDAQGVNQIPAAWYKIVEKSGFLHVTDEGNGNWTHEAYHEKRIEGIPYLDRP